MTTFEERLQAVERDHAKLEQDHAEIKQDNARLKQDNAELKQKIELQTMILRELAGNARLDQIALLLNTLAQEK